MKLRKQYGEKLISRVELTGHIFRLNCSVLQVDNKNLAGKLHREKSEKLKNKMVKQLILSIRDNSKFQTKEKLVFA